jgi:hypothetical protein
MVAVAPPLNWTIDKTQKQRKATRYYSIAAGSADDCEQDGDVMNAFSEVTISD